MSLPPEDPDELRAWWGRQSPEEQHRLASLWDVAKPAREFVEQIWGEKSLTRAWPLVDPLLRHCLSQHWLYNNRSDLAASGWQVDEVTAAFMADQPSHPLWHHMERVQLRDLHSTWDDLRSWGSGTATRLYGPDIEAVTFFPPGLKVFEPGATSVMYQFLMRYDVEAGWRVLNLWDYFPEPGWPPRLWAESPA
jgi:hypothetical protein